MWIFSLDGSVPDFLHERLTEIAAAKSMSVSRLAELALRSFYAVKASGKRDAPPKG